MRAQHRHACTPSERHASETKHNRYSSVPLQWAGFVRTAVKMATGQCRVHTFQVTTAGWILFKRRCAKTQQPKRAQKLHEYTGQPWRRTFRVPMRMSCGGLSVMRLRSASSGLFTWSRFCNSIRAFSHVKPPGWRYMTPPKCTSVYGDWKLLGGEPETKRYVLWCTTLLCKHILAYGASVKNRHHFRRCILDLLQTIGV